MTIQDVLNEWAVYPHSKEHFELVKECTELKLLEQYIADQKYVVENAESLKSLTESAYFVEAATAERLQQITEMKQVKAGAIIARIKAIFKKIIAFVKTFFTAVKTRAVKFAQKIQAKIGITKVSNEKFKNLDDAAKAEFLKDFKTTVFYNNDRYVFTSPAIRTAGKYSDEECFENIKKIISHVTYTIEKVGIAQDTIALLDIVKIFSYLENEEPEMAKSLYEKSKNKKTVTFDLASGDIADDFFSIEESEIIQLIEDSDSLSDLSEFASNLMATISNTVKVYNDIFGNIISVINNDMKLIDDEFDIDDFDEED